MITSFAMRMNFSAFPNISGTTPPIGKTIDAIEVDYHIDSSMIHNLCIEIAASMPHRVDVIISVHGASGVRVACSVRQRRPIWASLRLDQMFDLHTVSPAIDT